MTQVASDPTTRTSEPPPAEPVARISNLVKRFRRADGTIAPAVDDVTLDVGRGEFLVLLGPSGCGKTTLLRCLAGLERPDAGTIEIVGRTVYSSERKIEVPPERRELSMVFQSYALWPHMTAFDNVAYPLRHGRGKRIRKREITERVVHAFELVGIPELLRQYPSQMSGGQQQRVALARALVGGSELVLFDEPLSNVDAKVREKLRLELLSMQRELGFAAVYVTHDQVEAMELGHRIAVMREGKLAQVGAAHDIYDGPRTRYVANFVGTSNELVGTIASSAGELVVAKTDLGEIRGRTPERVVEGARVAAISRPERWRVLLEEPGAGENVWQGVLEASQFLGSYVQHVVRVGEHHVVVWSGDLHAHRSGENVWVTVDPADVRVLPFDEGPAE